MMADKRILEEELAYLTGLISNHKKKTASKSSHIPKKTAPFKRQTTSKTNYTWKRDSPGSKEPKNHQTRPQPTPTNPAGSKYKWTSGASKLSNSIITTVIDPLALSNAAAKSKQRVPKFINRRHQKSSAVIKTQSESPAEMDAKNLRLTSTPIDKQNGMSPVTLKTPSLTKMMTTVKSKYKIEKQPRAMAISPIVRALPKVATGRGSQPLVSPGNLKANAPLSLAAVAGKQDRTWYNPLRMKSGKHARKAAQKSPSSFRNRTWRGHAAIKPAEKIQININHRKRKSPFTHKNPVKITRYSIQRGSAVPTHAELRLVNRHRLVRLGKTPSRFPERRLQHLARSVPGTGQRATGHNQRVTKNRLLKKTRTKIIRDTGMAGHRKEVVNFLGQRFMVSSNGKALRRVRSTEGNKKKQHLWQATLAMAAGPSTTATSPTVAPFPLPQKNITRELARRAIHRSIYQTTQAKYKKRRSRASDYCMFYNRFGRCNRGDQCPYIHDPDKVAVCTRFLKGTCRSDGSCPFSHQVNKDKMPVCSYFLRGVCNRDDCPYSHVKVSHTAAVCQDFLKGYCPLGKKCTKKHTLECPEFSQARKCPQGDKCKLKHTSRPSRTTKPQYSAAHKGKEKVSPDQEDQAPASVEEGSHQETTSNQALHKLPSFISLAKYSDSPEEASTNTTEPQQQEEESLQIRPRFLSF